VENNDSILQSANDINTKFELLNGFNLDGGYMDPDDKEGSYMLVATNHDLNERFNAYCHNTKQFNGRELAFLLIGVICGQRK
jgi:hypothetical protein